MKKKLLLIAVSVLVVSLGPWVIPVFRPWSAINCRHEEINVKTGQARYSRYLWFVKMSERVEDTTLSKVLGGASVDAADIEPWHRVNTFSPDYSHSPHYRFHGALFQVRLLERILERLPPDAERDRGIAREILRLWQTTGDDEGAGSYLYRVSKADSWTDGMWSMGCVPLPLAPPATLSSRPADAYAAAARQSDPEERYCQALELYQLLSEQGTDYYTLLERGRKGLLSEPQRKVFRRIDVLARIAMRWSSEIPNGLAAEADNDQIGEAIAALCRDADTNPKLRSDLGDLNRWDTMEFLFYSGNRCRAVFKQFYKQPHAETEPVGGVDLYLFKHRGKWELLHWSRWVS